MRVKRAITGDIVPSAKTEVGMCDGAQHSDENGSIQKVKRTRTTDVTPDCDSAQESAKKEIIASCKGFKIPKGKRTKASDVTLLTKPVSECDGILQPAVIEEVAATIEGLDNCSGRAKTRDVAPTTKLEGSMSICTQQSVDGEVVVVRGQSIHERMESNAKGQIAKGNEMVSFKIGDRVFYSQSYGSNRKDSKQYGPSVISQICGGNMYLLAGLKRKYHSNQLEKVNMITSQVNKVCAFLCWYTSFNLFIIYAYRKWSMQQVAAEHQHVQ